MKLNIEQLKIHWNLKIENWNLKPRKLVLFLGIVLLLATIFLHLSGRSFATWYDENYAYREKITIGNTGATQKILTFKTC